MEPGSKSSARPRAKGFVLASLRHRLLLLPVLLAVLPVLALLLATAWEQRPLSRNLIWAIAVIVLIVAASAVACALFVLRRVGAVVRAARRLSAGDLSARAAVGGPDEIGTMARAFNSMAERLQGRAEDEREAREQLAQRVGELEGLNQMGELLLSCFSVQEAYAVIGRLAARLFPAEAGAVFATDATGTLIEAVATWGPHALNAPTFSAEACWCLRNSRTHAVDDTASGVVCAHVPQPAPRAYVCAPLLAQGRALGALYVAETSPPAGDARAVRDARRRLTEAVAAQLGLGLANVEIREVLRFQSIHDPLTGLFNRRYMEETLERELHRARRSGRPMCVLMLDVDSFKQQNDAFGHDGGDAVLRELGPLLKGNL